MTAIWGTAGDAPMGSLSPWDTMTVGGLALPGLVRVAGTGIDQRLSEKKSAGMDGATVTDLGREIAKFTVTLILGAEQSDWDGFEMTLRLIRPVRTVNGKQELASVSVSHPAINALGITAVKFKRVGVPRPGSVVGTYEVELDCWEHRPPKPMPAKGTAHKSVKDLEAPPDVVITGTMRRTAPQTQTEVLLELTEFLKRPLENP